MKTKNNGGYITMNNIKQELLEQIKELQRQRDMIEDMIEEIYKRIDILDDKKDSFVA